MRRPASYSDSFLVFGGREEDLEPLRIHAGVVKPSLPTVPSATYFDLGDEGVEMTPRPVAAPVALSPQAAAEPSPPSQPPRIFLFSFKGVFHIFLISAFESVFYFLYINRSENAGILAAINSYYQPLVASCSTSWSPSTKQLVGYILANYIDQPAVDAAGGAASSIRAADNQQLVIWSTSYSAICLAACILLSSWSHFKGWHVNWKKLVGENLGFVVLLALYEIFFFRTIIYNYETLSTPELSRYIVDGLATCAAGTNDTSLSYR